MPGERVRNVPLLTAMAATIVALVLALVHTKVAPLPGIGKLEGLSIDARFKLRGARDPSSDRIVIVGIDDKLRAEAPEVIQTRRGYAKLIDALTGYDPKIIALDMFFDSPEIILDDELADRVRALSTTLAADPDEKLAEARSVLAAIVEELRGDELLAVAVAKSARVYLGAHFVDGKRVESAPEPEGLSYARHGEVADASGGGARRPTSAQWVTTTMPSIAKGAAGAGAINMFRDEDGVTRRMPLAVEYAGRYYMPLGLAVALADLGKTGDTRYLVGDSTLEAGGIELPVTRGASIVLDALGKDRIPRISAADVLSGKAPKAALAGKLVVVGFTYAAYDKVITPLDLKADGVELHATLAENVLGGRLIRGTGDLATLLATLLLCGCVCAAQLRRVRRRPWIPPLIAIAAVAIYIAVAALLFAKGTVIAIGLPAVLAAGVLIAATIGGLATEGREKAKLRAVFSQYVAGPVVDRILADPARAKLGGERKELTVLFSDIRGFSLFSEDMQPEQLAAFLGEYLTPMTELVLESEGTLDKYIGDAVMAIWGAPVDVPDHPARACETALRMQEKLVGLNATWAKTGKPVVAIGIGINTGAMAVGNMGSAARFDYTVLGDQVNLAARLEALTKEYGVSILCGETTANSAGAGFVFREIDLVRVKGRAGAVPVFELVGRATTVVEPTFVTALAAYRARDFATARIQFAALTGDAVAERLAARCEVLLASPPAEDWDGVYEQVSK
ncbi:adenylate/guanylate cyclase domain-containing protein [soil metagenome]